MENVKNYLSTLNHSWAGGKLIIKEIESVDRYVFTEKPPSWNGLEDKYAQHLRNKQLHPYTTSFQV